MPGNSNEKYRKTFVYTSNMLNDGNAELTFYNLSDVKKDNHDIGENNYFNKQCIRNKSTIHDYISKTDNLSEKLKERYDSFNKDTQNAVHGIYVDLGVTDDKQDDEDIHPSMNLLVDKTNMDSFDLTKIINDLGNDGKSSDNLWEQKKDRDLEKEKELTNKIKELYSKDKIEDEYKKLLDNKQLDANAREEEARKKLNRMKGIQGILIAVAIVAMLTFILATIWMAPVFMVPAVVVGAASLGGAVLSGSSATDAKAIIGGREFGDVKVDDVKVDREEYLKEAHDYVVDLLQSSSDKEFAQIVNKFSNADNNILKNNKVKYVPSSSAEFNYIVSSDATILDQVIGEFDIGKKMGDAKKALGTTRIQKYDLENLNQDMNKENQNNIRHSQSSERKTDEPQPLILNVNRKK